MGGAVSSGESNDELIDNLLEADYIKSPLVEQVFRAVDRALYYTSAYKSNAYKDLAWKDGNLHLSAPCIYSEVMENLELKEGMSFLNMGSGTGYLSTMCGLIIGKHGVNHGIELFPEVVEYARDKLEEFVRTSDAIDLFDFCEPEFVVGNCLDPISSGRRYDRIYCGAACPEESIQSVTELLKIGGICVLPVNDSLMQITRVAEDKDDRKTLLPVSFATLIAPRKESGDGAKIEKKVIELPKWKPPSLKELCRYEIRLILRNGILASEPNKPQEGRKKRRRRRQERRRASRLLVVQRRRDGAEEGETGFVAVAYSLGNNSSDEDQDQDQGGSGDEEMHPSPSDTNSSSDSLELPDVVEPMEMDVPPTTTPPPKVENGASSVHNAVQNSAQSPSPNVDENSPLTRPGFLSRARTARQNLQLLQQGPDGLLGRLREIYRRREQRNTTTNNSGSLVRQVGQNLSSASNATARFRQLISSRGTNLTNPTPTSPVTSTSTSTPTNSAVQSTKSKSKGANSLPSSKRKAKNKKKSDSTVWSSTPVSTDEDDGDKAKPEPELCPSTSGSGTNGKLKTDLDEDEDSNNSNMDQLDLDFDGEESTERLKRNPVSVQMRERIQKLLLPNRVKLYLNFYREFDSD